MNIPCSKSYAQRAILISIFSNSNVVINGIGKNMSDDISQALDLLTTLNIKSKMTNKAKDKYEISIDSTKVDLETLLSKNISFFTGESGTLTRMLIAILSSYPGKFDIDGTGSLLNRRLDSIKNFFDLSDVEFISNNGKLPITICGKNNNFFLNESPMYEFDGSKTSQYISGIIIAYAIRNRKTIFKIKNCFSIEYVKITVDILNQFGYDVSIIQNSENLYSIIINEVKRSKKKYVINIESDWSCLAANIIYNLVNEDKELKYDNANINSCQCDKRVMDLVLPFCEIDYNSDTNILSFNKLSDIKPFEFNCANSPDLFPVACALAATCKTGYSKIIGLDKVANKESDRGKVIYEEFKKCGIHVSIEENSILIKGTDDYINSEYNSHNDHRIAMALIILRKFYGDYIPDKDDCLNKSYSNFLEDIKNE